jgi:hypothetical protein
MDEKATQELIRNIQNISSYAQDHHVMNYRVWAALVSLSLVLVAATTLAGFLDKGQLAGFLSIVNGFVIAIQSAFAFGDAAQFYRLLHTQAEVLLLDSHDAKNPDDYLKITAFFMSTSYFKKSANS